MNENKKEIIKLENVCRSYTSCQQWHHVLKNLSMTIHEGEFTVIMGVSGEGKSTLMRLLMGIDAVTIGNINICGHDFVALNEYQRSQIRATHFGYLSQENNFLSNFSIYENLMVQAFVSKAKVDEKRLYALMKQLGIDKKMFAKKPEFLSSGERQRCALAKAVIHSPNILFMDEPTENLNRANTDRLLNLLSDLNREGQTMIMVTHDVNAATRANRVLYLSEGKIQDEIMFDQMDHEINLEERKYVLMDFLEKQGW